MSENVKLQKLVVSINGVEENLNLNSSISGGIVYSVNSAYRNSSGYADFITRVSDTEVSFKVDDGTSYEPLSIKYPDGSQADFTTLSNVSGLSSDGNYIFVIEKGNTTASACTGNVSEGYSLPTSPSSGDYHLDISARPYKPYKYNGSSWEETQFVKLGEATKTSGTLGAPVSYALNGMYDSGEVSVTGSSTTGIDNDIIHNIGETFVDGTFYIYRSDVPVWFDLHLVYVSSANENVGVFVQPANNLKVTARVYNRISKVKFLIKRSF